MRPETRHYDESFKVSVVKTVLSGEITKEAARQKYHIGGKSTILKWIRLYEKYGRCTISIPLYAMPDNTDTTSDKVLQARIKELEKQLEEAELAKELYSRMVDIAERDFKISIRKKSNTK